MIVDCAVYREGRRQQVEAMSLTEAAAQRGPDTFVWLGTFDPSPAELAEIRDTFGLHELAVEDAREFHLRPKVEQFDDDVQLVILRTARYDDAREEIDFGEISVFLGVGFVITVRQGVASELRGARLRLERRPELLEFGSAAVLWAILDQVVDGYAPVIGEVERDIEQLESTVFSGAVAPTERIYFLRREVTNFYLAVISVEQTKVSVLQNATIEQLTKLSTIFLPLTFVTGFFGQNFGWLVDNIGSLETFLVFGVGGLVIPCVLLLSWFRMNARRRADQITGSVAPLDEVGSYR